jgi:hypothetical protein
MVEIESYITPREAAERAQVSEATVINWCLGRYRSLGIRVGGRWRINPRVLGRILDGTIGAGRESGAGTAPKNAK